MAVLRASRTRRVVTAALGAGLAASAMFALPTPAAQADDCSDNGLEDGLQILGPDGLDLDGTYIIVSGGWHKGTEDNTRDYIDPITVPLLGINSTDVVHHLACDVVVPLEDRVDEVTIPVITGLLGPGALSAIGDLFR